MYYFYILLSEKDKKYYYGSTTDLKRRVREHNLGNVSATNYRRPLRLTYYEAYENLHTARNREKQVKLSGSVRLALHKRINPNILADGPARPSAGQHDSDEGPARPPAGKHDSDEGPARPPAGKPGQ